MAILLSSDHRSKIEILIYLCLTPYMVVRADRERIVNAASSFQPQEERPDF